MGTAGRRTGVLVSSIGHPLQRSVARSGCGCGSDARGLPATVFDSATPFPGYAAIAPVAGAALLIQYAPGTRVGAFLAWRPLVFVGLISYSAYLWHQPLFALARYLSLDGEARYRRCADPVRGHAGSRHTQLAICGDAISRRACCLRAPPGVDPGPDDRRGCHSCVDRGVRKHGRPSHADRHEYRCAVVGVDVRRLHDHEQPAFPRRWLPDRSGF